MIGNHIYHSKAQNNCGNQMNPSKNRGGKTKTLPDESVLAAKVEFECKMLCYQTQYDNQQVKAGVLLSMDVGCELLGYLSDHTRTWSPCGIYSSAQEELYGPILETNKECLKLCGPGVSIRQIRNYSIEMLVKGLVKLGIIKDSPNSLQFCHYLNPTSIYHYLGMDIHDCAMISTDSPLQPAVVITNEPGLYITPSTNAPQRYQGVGIRIEDEVLVTDTGYEVGNLQRNRHSLVRCRKRFNISSHSSIMGSREPATMEAVS